MADDLSLDPCWLSKFDQRQRIIRLFAIIDFLTQDRNLLRAAESEPNFTVLNFNHGHFDVLGNPYRFTDFSTEN